MGIYYSKDRAFGLLMDYWGKNYQLDSDHEQWLRNNATVLVVQKGQVLYMEGDRQRHVYFVCTGLLARQKIEEKYSKRHLLDVAPPDHSIFTTKHLYSKTPIQGDIISLRPSVVIRIPYHSLQLSRYEDAAIENLVDRLANKQQSIIQKLHVLFFIDEPSKRYAQFLKELPDLVKNLTQQEQADLLHISKRTVQRGTKFR